MLFQRPLIQWLAGLRVHHQLANHRACGTKPTRILTLLRCCGVATKDFRPLRPGFPDIASVPFFLTRIKCACPARPEWLIGILLAGREGLEVNLLGLSFGVDPVRPALKAPQHRLKFGNRHLHLEIGRNIVGLHRIGQRHQRWVADLEEIGLVVVDPAADIADAGFGEVVERVPGLR
jgi:hypothetical protein